MTAAEMDIVIGADVNGAVNGLKKVNNSLESFSSESQLSARHAIGFSRGLEELAVQAQYGQLNMGGFFEVLRVGAQEFQNIQRETGSTATAFKALAGSIFTSQTIFLLATTVIASLVSHLLEGSRAAKEAAQSTDELTKAQAGFNVEAEKIGALASVAKSYSESLTTRKNAIDELQKLYPGYLSNINLENINSQKAANAIDLLTAALARKAKMTELTNLLNKDEEKLSLEQNKSIEDNAGFLQKLFLKYGHGVQLLSAFRGAEQNRTDAIMTEQIATDKLVDAIKALTTEQAKAGDFKLLDPKKTKAAGETISKILADLNAAITKDNLLEKTLGLDESQQKITAIEDAIERLLKIKVPANSTIISQLLGDISTLQLPATLKAFGEFIKKNFAQAIEQAPFQSVSIADSILHLSDIDAKNALQKMRDTLNKAGVQVFSSQGILSSVPLLNDAEVKANFDKLNEKLKGTAALVTDVLQVAFESVFQSIQQGVSVFDALGKAIKQLVVRLVESVIEAAALAFIFSLFGGPAFSIEAIKGLLNFPHFATGGVVTKPTLAVVGEQGPERITPLGYEGNANNMMGGDVTFRIQGQELYGVLRRYNQSNSFIN